MRSHAIGRHRVGLSQCIGPGSRSGGGTEVWVDNNGSMIDDTSRAGKTGGGSFKREKNNTPNKKFAYRMWAG